ncbi:hypothetical protein COL940_013136 [Colletotrichum noveboracense]|nr:hypothetical protein COL940_013136 [Colletotrichum noveboracense]KAJ0273150.1 hypothetical protein CBS470a_012368 [Colletotrichum nupharicola]
MRAFHLSALLPAFLAVEASVLEAPIPGYEVYVPEWEVQVTPGGPTIILNGTVEEVVDKLHEINPDYEGFLNSTMEQSAGLQKRTDFSGTQVFCGNFGAAERDRFFAGIGYLRGVGGRPSNGAGPGNCGRVSCSWRAAVWWCNDVSSKSNKYNMAKIITDALR